MEGLVKDAKITEDGLYIVYLIEDDGTYLVGVSSTSNITKGEYIEIKADNFTPSRIDVMYVEGISGMM